MDKKFPFESWFEGSYTYKFGRTGDADPFWHFAEPQTWRFKCEGLSAPVKLVEGLAQKLHEGRTQVLALADFPSPPAPRSDPIAWLLATEPKSPNLSVIAGPPSVMLNNACRSESIQRFKVVSTYVGSFLTVELIGSKIGEPRWFFHDYGKRARILWDLMPAFPQAFGSMVNSAEVNFVPNDAGVIKETARLLQAFRLLQTYTITKYERTSVELENEDFTETLNIRLQIESELSDYRRGRTCWSLPIPGIRANPLTGTRIQSSDDQKADVIDTPMVVVRSPRVVQSLEILSTVWQDRFLSTVLITAPAGAGKEQYSASIPFGNGRGECAFHILSLASGDKATLERQLYGTKRDDGSIAEGLIAKSAGGTLFLDEVHQPDYQDGIRASLLRTLENNSYFPVGSSEEAKVNKVLFVLATSRRMTETGTGSSGDALEKVPPTDFWTRMAHVIELPHPLMGLDEKDLDESLECFFKHFWWERVTKVFGVIPFSCQGRETTAKILQREQAEELLHETKLERAAVIFRDALNREFTSCRHTIPDKLGNRPATHEDLSIRGIRSMVSNLVSMSTGEVLAGREWLIESKSKAQNGPVNLNTKAKDGPAKSFEDRAKDVIAAVLPVALIKPKKSRRPDTSRRHVTIAFLRRLLKRILRPDARE